MSEELARKLKAARQKLNLSQSQAAKRWAMSLRTLVSWENRERTPRGLSLKLVNEMLDRILAE